MQTPADGTPALQPQCREQRGWREARGAQTYQAWNTERRKRSGRSLADMVRTALAGERCGRRKETLQNVHMEGRMRQ